VIKAFTVLLDKAFRTFLASLMVLMVVCVSWQVISRYALNSPSPWTEELARFSLIWIGLLGAAYAYHLKMHLGLDLLILKLSPHNAIRLKKLLHALSILFASVVMVYGGIQLVLMTYELEQFSAALGWPMYWVYLCLPISGSMLVVYAVLDWFELSSMEVTP
jgi:TRAP-type C4-dicarboxylate transport system permease small subunit